MGLLRRALGIVQHIVQVGALILAVALAFVPRRDDIVGLAALGGALLVAFQLATTYWFYLYIVWSSRSR